MVAFLFVGCQREKKQYRFEVTYTNGEVNILTFEGYGENRFSLDNGDLKTAGVSYVSGVRSFKFLSIINLGVVPVTSNNGNCSCYVKLVNTEKKD